MNHYDSDNLDRGMYDDLEQKHAHESLNWTDNVFGESIPGADEDTTDAAGDDGADVTEDLAADDDVAGDDALPASDDDEGVEEEV